MTGRWLDGNTKEKLSATAITPTRIPCTMTASGCRSGSRFDKDHTDTVNGTMSADRKTITWDNTHLIGFGVWIKCTGQEARCTGAIRYTDNTKFVVKEGYKRWPYVDKGYHFLVPTNRLYDVKFKSTNPSVAPLDLATIEFTVGEMAEGEWLGWRSKPQYCHGDEKMPCVPEQYKGFDMHVALEGAMLGSSPLPYRKVNPFSPRHYSSLAPYVWEHWDSSLMSQVAAATHDAPGDPAGPQPSSRFEPPKIVHWGASVYFLYGITHTYVQYFLGSNEWPWALESRSQVSNAQRILAQIWTQMPRRAASTGQA